MKRLPFLFAAAIFCLGCITACTKDNSTAKVPPYLTEKLWVLDTIVVNAPLTYDALTDQQKFDYNAALGWSKNKAEVTFNNDGSVTCGGDWDMAYTRWELQNDDKDLRMTQGNIGYDTLRSWEATSTQFSYIHAISSEPFDCTLIYK